MKVRLPKYTRKDYTVMLCVMLPFTMVLNSVIFRSLYFSDWKIFVLATIITGTGVCIDFILCGFVAVKMKKRFPLEKDVSRKLVFMILSFWLFTTLFLYLLFGGYEWIGFYGYSFNENAFIWSCIALGIVNVFLTFLMEGVAGYESWKDSMEETEKLSKAYNQSRLLGLKSQVNPHFLFNSLNALSSLISEDEQEAEKFLDEMSKVYRYMLRNEADQLVTLETELKFVDSYYYLLRVRYGDALQLAIAVHENDKWQSIPPLTLQVIIENSFTLNALNKNAPLQIVIQSNGTGVLEIKNNIQPKIITDHINYEAGLDNLVNRYYLLTHHPLTINETQTERCISIPLITRKAEVEA
ncbi:MAG TPA: sensor histidine kinase [Agriterribacter sp.]|nr:sensor histidine kinase [Agriterribacter sp.]